MSSTPPPTVSQNSLDLTTPPTLAVLPSVRSSTTSLPLAPHRAVRFSRIKKDKEAVANRIFGTEKKIALELKKKNPDSTLLDSLRALKAQWEQRFDTLSLDAAAHVPINYRTDFPSLKRKKSSSPISTAVHTATVALNDTTTADAVITTLLAPAQNLPSINDSSSDTDSDSDSDFSSDSDSEDSDSNSEGFIDDDPNFFVNGFHGFSRI